MSHDEKSQSMSAQHLEAELKARERIALAAEHEIERAWNAYEQIVKLIRLVIGIVAVLVAILGIFGYRSWMDFKQHVQESANDALRAEVTNVQMLVRQQFQEPRISNIVVGAASLEASNLLAQAVAPEIARFNRSLSQMLDEIPTNLYSRMSFESICDTNSTRFFRRQLVGGNFQAFLLLQHTPVTNSLSGRVSSPFVGMQPLGAPNEIRHNVFVVEFGRGWPFGGTVVQVQYISDPADTNVIKDVEFTNSVVYFDGIPQPSVSNTSSF